LAAILIALCTISVAAAPTEASGNDKDIVRWRMLVDRARRAPTPHAINALARVPEIFADDSAVIIELADRLGAPGAADAASALALRWISAVNAPDALHTARELTRARLLRNRGHLMAALEIVGTLNSQADAAEDVRRLYAELVNAAGARASRLQNREAHVAPHRARDEVANPSATLLASYASSNGYDGQRLLSWSETGGRVTVPMSEDRSQRLDLSASTLMFNNPSIRLPAYSGRVLVSTMSQGIGISGDVALVRGARNLAYLEAHGDATFALGDALRLRVGAERTPLLENISTVRDGLMAAGPFASVTLATPDTHLSLGGRTAWVGNNVDREWGIAGRRRARAGTNHLWVVGALSHTAWKYSDVRYFSPESFTRVDTGAEWVHPVGLPAPRTDQQSALIVRYVAGFDSRGAWYHQPHARLSLQHRRVAVDAEMSLVESSVYRFFSSTLSVRIGG
jgi:hypothetical protein